MRSTKSISATLVVAALAVLMLGVLTARGNSQRQAQIAMKRHVSTYLARASFGDSAQQGVVEALMKISGNPIPIPVDVLISVHGLQPNVVYSVVGSRHPCNQGNRPVDEIFDVDLPVSASTDRFFKQRVDGGLPVKDMKSARLFENGARIRCVPTKLYVVGRYP